MEYNSFALLIQIREYETGKPFSKEEHVMLIQHLTHHPHKLGERIHFNKVEQTIWHGVRNGWLRPDTIM